MKLLTRRLRQWKQEWAENGHCVNFSAKGTTPNYAELIVGPRRPYATPMTSFEPFDWASLSALTSNARVVFLVTGSGRDYAGLVADEGRVRLKRPWGDAERGGTHPIADIFTINAGRVPSSNWLRCVPT